MTASKSSHRKGACSNSVEHALHSDAARISTHG